MLEESKKQTAHLGLIKSFVCAIWVFIAVGFVAVGFGVLFAQ
jgi:hypothetical protein